jgi:hypothetical protein
MQRIRIFTESEMPYPIPIREIIHWVGGGVRHPNRAKSRGTRHRRQPKTDVPHRKRGKKDAQPLFRGRTSDCDSENGGSIPPGCRLFFLHYVAKRSRKPIDLPSFPFPAFAWISMKIRCVQRWDVVRRSAGSASVDQTIGENQRQGTLAMRRRSTRSSLSLWQAGGGGPHGRSSASPKEESCCTISSK